MQRRRFIKVGGGVIGTGMIAGCSGGDGGDGGTGDGGGGDGGGDGGDGGSGDGGGGSTTTSQPEEPIVIGAIEPLSGPFTPWGTVHRAGLEFGIAEINADGGVMGRELALEVVDTGSDPAEADSSFRRLVEQENAVAMTGPVSSDVGIRTRITAQELQVPLFLHMSGTTEATLADTRYVFRVGLHPAPTFLRAHLDLAQDRGYSKYAIIAADYAWGNSVKSAAEDLTPDDLEVQIQLAPIGESDFNSYLRQIDSDIDMMIAGAHPPGVIPIVKQQIELGIEPEVTTGAGYPPGLLANALGEDVYGSMTHTHLADPTKGAFADAGSRFAESNDGYFNTHHAYGWETARIIAQAVESAGSTDPAAIADAVRSGTFDLLHASPIEYQEWGGIKNPQLGFSTFEQGGPDYYPDGSFSLNTLYTTSQLESYVP